MRFEWDRLDDETYRRAYAFVPQSSVADLTNQAMVRVWHEGRRRGWRSRLRLQVHDALVLACPPDEVEEVVACVREGMEREVEYDGAVKLSIPATIKMGTTWKMTHEWKGMPDEGELEAAANALVTA